MAQNSNIWNLNINLVYRRVPSAIESYNILKLSLGFSMGKLEQTTGALNTQDPF